MNMKHYIKTHSIIKWAFATTLGFIVGISSHAWMSPSALSDHVSMDRTNTYQPSTLEKNQNSNVASSFKDYTGKRISLNFQDIDVKTGLQVIAKYAPQPISIDDTITGTITVHLVNIPWELALDVIVAQNNLHITDRDSGLVIGPKMM